MNELLEDFAPFDFDCDPEMPMSSPLEEREMLRQQQNIEDAAMAEEMEDLAWAGLEDHIEPSDLPGCEMSFEDADTFGEIEAAYFDSIMEI